MIPCVSRKKSVLFALVAFSGVFGVLAPNPMAAQMTLEQEWLPTTEKLSFQSEIMGEERTILVRLPEGYDRTTRKYPVLYVLDGEYFFQQAVSAVQFGSELGYARGQHPIPELIVVGIVNVDRDRDYTPTHAPEQSQGRLSFPTSGGGDLFERFLEVEVFPIVELRYRAHPDRTLTGWSLGGLFTVRTYLENPDLFSRYLAISPSMWWDDSVTIRETRDLLSRGGTLSPKPLIITLGSLEGSDMDGSVRKNFVPLLRNQGPLDLDFTFIEIPEEGHSYVPYKAYYDGLLATFADWIVPGEVLQRGLVAVEAFFDDLADRYGHPVDVPLSVYRLLSTTLPDIGLALEAAHVAVSKYPRSSVAHIALGRLQQMAGDRVGARETLRKALELELERPIPQSENLRGIRARLRALGNE